MQRVMKRSLSLARFFLPVLVLNLSGVAWAGPLEDLGLGSSLSSTSGSSPTMPVMPSSSPTMQVMGPASEIMQADRNLTSVTEPPAVPQEEPIDPDH